MSPTTRDRFSAAVPLMDRVV